ncbi:MAG: nucleoside phosphorylase [Flavobacteriales bacterium]|nr:nucleoside phosphorylase [Flavobacteriales bacterium]
MKRFLESELILHEDGSIYHLGLKPEEISNLIFTVGDPERVPKVSRYFDELNMVRSKREFLTHGGRIGTKPVTVLSTGMGTDNIDIVFHELDALVNVDFETRIEKDQLSSLCIIRLGTTGLIQEEDAIDTLLVSEFAIDGSGLAPWYPHTYSVAERKWIESIASRFPELANPGCFGVNGDLIEQFSTVFSPVVTYTSSGFYHPQGRTLRIQGHETDFLDRLSGIGVGGRKISNIEMETAGMYGLGRLLGHRVLSLNAALANRRTGSFSSDPERTIESMILKALEISENL